jgi:acetoacetate decarboxylase
MIIKSTHKAVALSILLCATPTYTVKFEAADIISPLQSLAAAFLLPLIMTYDAANAPELCAINEYATPDIQKMCASWKRARKPNAVREACEELNDALYEIAERRKVPADYITESATETISRAYGKKRSADTETLVADMNTKMSEIKKELSS